MLKIMNLFKLCIDGNTSISLCLTFGISAFGSHYEKMKAYFLSYILINMQTFKKARPCDHWSRKYFQITGRIKAEILLNSWKLLA
jgi:hypothetical protein